MAIKFQPIRYRDLSGGMQTTTVNHLMLDSEVKLARNCILDEIGALKKRKGYSQIGTQITAGTAILGNYYFVDKDTTYSNHVATCSIASGASATLYYNKTGTWTALKTGFNVSAKMRFESFLDKMFLFNMEDSAYSWDGNPSNAPSATTCLTGSPKCKYGRVFQDRLYFAHESANPSRVYFSSVPSSGAITWDITNDYLDVNPEDGQVITGLGENSGRLLIFKDESMFRWTGYSTEPDPIIDVGTSSQESVATIHGKTYFANRYGVYVYDGGMPYLISRKIQNWIDAIDQSKLSSLAAEADNDHYYLSVGDVTIDGTFYTGAMFIYHIPLQAWTIWDLQDTPKVLAPYYSSGARLLSFGDVNGEVFRLNNGNNDDTSAIPVNIETKQYDMEIPEEEKRFNEVYVVTTKAKGLVEIGAKLDENSIETIGYTDGEDVTKLPSSLMGKKLGITLAESGTGEQWSFDSLIFRDVYLSGTT